jgi:hypothetical protein
MLPEAKTIRVMGNLSPLDGGSLQRKPDGDGNPCYHYCRSGGVHGRCRKSMARILLADDHELIRKGLRAPLEVKKEWLICAVDASHNHL